MPTINVLDATGSAQALETPNVNGQSNMAGSRPVVIASNQSPVAVNGPLTDTQLRAAVIPVSVSGTLPAFAATPAFSISGTLPAFAATPTFNLGTLNGAATEATLVAASAKLPAVLGQAARAASMSVTIANDQTDVPTVTSDIVVTATNITTRNLVPAGVATTNSAVAISPSGRSGLTIQVTGVYTGALSLQGTVDGGVWVTIGGTPLVNVATGVASATIVTATQGIFQAECSGFAQVRLTALAAVTGTAAVTLRATDMTSVVNLTDPLPTGTNSLGNLGTVTTVSTVTAVTGITDGTAISPSATVGGYTTRTSVVSAATTNATLLKATPGTIGSIIASNTSAAVKFLKIFSKATAPATGTDTPVMNIMIPAGQTAIIENAAGFRIPTGIGFAITNGAALLDNTAVAAGDVLLNIDYI